MMTDERTPSEEHYDYMLEVRGIVSPCGKCGGAGIRCYGNTATWRGGIGGQAITNAICDACWGSGDELRPWADMRKMEGEFKRLEVAKGEYDRLLRAYKQRDADVVRLTEERDALATWRDESAGLMDMWKAERDKARHEAAGWYRQVGKDGQEIKCLRAALEVAREGASDIRCDLGNTTPAEFRHWTEGGVGRFSMVVDRLDERIARIDAILAGETQGEVGDGDV